MENMEETETELFERNSSKKSKVYLLRYTQIYEKINR